MSAEGQIIPDDIMAAAMAAVIRNFKSRERWSETIARAILAERERCAAVADSFTPGGERYEYGNDTATADAIRRAILEAPKAEA